MYDGMTVSEVKALRQRQIHERGPLEAWEGNQASRVAHWRKLQWRAYKAVQKAIQAGDLLELPNPQVGCVDCGAPATVYDHRDYERPLEVQAVCQSCNLRRGSAKHAPIPDIPDPLETHGDYRDDERRDDRRE